MIPKLIRTLMVLGFGGKGWAVEHRLWGLLIEALSYWQRGMLSPAPQGSKLTAAKGNRAEGETYCKLYEDMEACRGALSGTLPHYLLY